MFEVMKSRTQFGSLFSPRGYGDAWEAQILVMLASAHIYTVTSTMYRGKTPIDAIMDGSPVVVELDQADETRVSRWWLAGEGAPASAPDCCA